MADKKEVITATYKVNLHCRQCAREIKKPLLRTQGVQSVDVDVEKGEIKVKGVIEAEKIHKQIEKWGKKKVELISNVAAVPEKKNPDGKKESIHTTVLKVHMHCALCEKDLKKKLIKQKGIHSVKTDRKAQTLTVEGTIESTKLLTYIKKKTHKHAEIISSKTDSKDEEKKKEEEEKKKKKEEEEKKKKKEEEEEEKKKKKKKEEEEKKEEAAEVDVTKATDVVEFKEKVKVEVKDKDGTTLYFIHYVYAPQLFSDENPNACSIV